MTLYNITFCNEQLSDYSKVIEGYKICCWISEKMKGWEGDEMNKTSRKYLNSAIGKYLGTITEMAEVERIIQIELVQ